jgi:predicted DNA-binding transcriptional regulator AlpA
MADINLAQILLTETDLARQLRVSLAALRKWRVMKRGPQFVKIGSLVRYRQHDIDVWLASLPVGGSLSQETAFGLGPERPPGQVQAAATGHGNARLIESAGTRQRA